MKLPTIVLIITVLSTGAVHAATLDQLLQEYRTAGAGPFSAAAGAALWTREGGAQTCTTCHNADLRSVGKHAKTGKAIDPMAPSVNPKRITDDYTIEKWFRRNCESAWGRACTAQEKGDILTYIRTQ